LRTPVRREVNLGTLPLQNCNSYFYAKDTDRWAVWVGRHALENLTRAPNGRLRQVRNLPLSARAKAGLTWFGTTTNHDAKAGPSEPLNLLSEGE
jgi:hypothetical protein